VPAEKETKQKEEQAPKTKKERVDFEMLPKKSQTANRKTKKEARGTEASEKTKDWL